MANLKTLALASCLILSSCNWFTQVPESVTTGQMTAYRGVEMAERNLDRLITDCATRLRKMSVYIHNYGWQIEHDRISAEHPKHTILYYEDDEAAEHKEQENVLIEARIDALLKAETKKRDKKIAEDEVKIQAWEQEWRDKLTPNYIYTKKLIEAVYNWMSVSPLTIDNIANLVVDTTEAWERAK